MTQNSWKILVTKSNDDAMHYYFFFKRDKNEGKFPSWGNLPICKLWGLDWPPNINQMIIIDAKIDYGWGLRLRKEAALQLYSMLLFFLKPCNIVVKQMSNSFELQMAKLDRNSFRMENCWQLFYTCLIWMKVLGKQYFPKKERVHYSIARFDCHDIQSTVTSVNCGTREKGEGLQ